MADPTVTQIASGTSQTATTTVSFTAQPSGTLLVLVYSGDDYPTTSGSGRPESTGWTQVTGSPQQTSNGHGLWWKLSTGSDTSVQYTISAAVRTCHAVLAADNIAQTGTVDVSNGQNVGSALATYTTPTVTTSSGRRLAVGTIAGARFSAPDFTGQSTWLNGYTEVSDVVNNGSSPQVKESLGVAYLILDGGGTTSTGSTFSTSAESRTGIIAVFKVADAAAPGLPILVMPTR